MIPGLDMVREVWEVMHVFKRLILPTVRWIIIFHRQEEVADQFGIALEQLHCRLID